MKKNNILSYLLINSKWTVIKYLILKKVYNENWKLNEYDKL